jgi:enoyl-CoA hydratase/carnithine racemase
MAEPTSGLLLVHRDGAIATLTLNRPDARNAINDELRETILEKLGELRGDATIAAVVITGAGTAFCAGGDLSSMRQRLRQPATEVAFNGWQRQQRTADFVAAVHKLGQVTIAAVNGPAVGLGLDLALACDFIIASGAATFASSFVRRGLIPDGGGLYFLPRRIGLQATKDLVFTGRSVGTDEALRLGLIDRVAEGDDVVATAVEYAATMAGNSRSALMLTKSILDRSFESTPEMIAAQGGSAQAISYTTADHRGAVEKFFQK